MKRKKRTFGTKLYRMFLISIGIPVIIATACFCIYSDYLSVQRETRNVRSILNATSQNLELQFSEVNVIKKAFYDKTIFRMAETLNNPRLCENYDELVLNDMEKLYEVKLSNLMLTSSQIIRSIVFFPASGTDQGYYLGRETAELQTIDYPDYKEEIWYRKAYENPVDTYYLAPHIPAYMSNKNLGEVYSSVSALQNMDSRKIIGVLKFDVDAGNIQNMLDMQVDSEKNGVVMFQGNSVFAQSGNLGRIKTIRDDVISTVQGKYWFLEWEVPDTDISLFYLYSVEDYYQSFAVVILICLAVLACGAFLAFLYYRYHATLVVNDVRKITEVIRMVEKGKLDTHIEINDESELGEISVAINRMIDNLKEYIENEYILVIQRQKAEYRALQSQINPHFLYNTLNGFVALNRMGDKKTLEKSIIGLSKLFRYTCSKQEMVPLKQEIEFLEEYLKLEKLKYEERLEYIVWLDHQCEDFDIPRLLLQPVVENSIKHGMGDGEIPILIRISAMKSQVKGIGEIVILTVRDNGVGFDTNEADTEHQGVGVDNVRIRAELYCRDVIYQCTSQPGEGTKTTFIFPGVIHKEEL